MLGGVICTLEEVIVLELLPLADDNTWLFLAEAKWPPTPGVCEVTTVASAPTQADSETTSPVDKTIFVDGWWEVTAEIPELPLNKNCVC